MARRSTQTPRIVCTGYELTEPLRRYLEVGHGMDPSGDLFISLGDDDHDEEDYDDDGDYGEDGKMDEKGLAAQREAELVSSCQICFSLVRQVAPAEVRKALEIPYCEFPEVLCLV